MHSMHHTTIVPPRPPRSQLPSRNCIAKMAAVASIWRRPFDLLMVVYFATHIPTTVLVDSQAGQ
jgi:hypothetical protein